MNAKPVSELCDKLVDLAKAEGADEAEAAATSYRTVETSLENNNIHAAQTTSETVFGLRVFKNNSLGFVTANRTDDETLKECVREALAQARVSPPDPHNTLPAPEDLGEVKGLYNANIADMTVADTTELAGLMLDRVLSKDERVRIDSGSTSATVAGGALCSTTGLRASEVSTSVGGSLFGMAVDGDDVASFDYDGDALRSRDGIADLLTSAADRFVEKCLSGLGAAAGKSFRGRAVLSPEVVGEFLVPNLLSSLLADSVRKGKSPLADKLGESVAAEAFTLVDDGTAEGRLGSSAFDREGQPVSKSVIVENGVLKAFLFNHYEALAAGGKTSGHANGGVSTLPGVGPHQLEVTAGSDALANMQNGGEGPSVYVGRFSGSTNPITGDFSGVVKNGFLIENGNRTPIKETLLAGNLFEVLKNIVAISSERRLMNNSECYPTILADGLSITAG